MLKLDQDQRASCLASALILVACGTIGMVAWVTASHFEAQAFNRVTGNDVSTWDAMFIELRVQEPVLPSKTTGIEAVQ